MPSPPKKKSSSTPPKKKKSTPPKKKKTTSSPSLWKSNLDEEARILRLYNETIGLNRDAYDRKARLFYKDLIEQQRITRKLIANQDHQEEGYAFD